MRFDQMTPEERRKISKKGGAATKGKFKLSKTRKCTSRCPLYHRCIYAPLSKNFEGRCALANIDISDRAKHRYLKLLRGTEDDFVENLKDLLAEVDVYARKEKSFKTLRKLIYDYINVFKTIFGIRLQQDIKSQQNITIDDVENQIRKIIEKEEKNGEKNG